MDDEDDDLESYWAAVRSQKPRPPRSWGDELAARVWKEPVVAIAGPMETRIRALSELQASLAQTVVQKPCLMLSPPGFANAWLGRGERGTLDTLVKVFSHYNFVNQRKSVQYTPYEGRPGELPALLVDTLEAARANRTTWTVEAGRQFLYDYWDDHTLRDRLNAGEGLARWLGLDPHVEFPENDLCIARLMNFLYLANKVKTISNIHLAFDCLDQGNNTELATIETMLKLIRDREDLFGCFALVLGWSGEDKMLNRLSQFAPVCEAALQNSLTVH